MFEVVKSCHSHAHLELHHFLVASGAIYLRVMRGKKFTFTRQSGGAAIEVQMKKSKRHSPSWEQIHVDVVTENSLVVGRIK